MAKQGGLIAQGLGVLLGNEAKLYPVIPGGGERGQRLPVLLVLIDSSLKGGPFQMSHLCSMNFGHLSRTPSS